MKASLSCAIVVLSCSSCVSQGKYDDALKNAADARASAERVSADAAAKDRGRDANAARLATDLRSAQASLEEQTAANGELRLALVESGVKAGLSRLRIEQLRAARSASEKRGALFRELAVKLASMIGDEEIEMKVRDGRMVLALSADVLFDSGRTEIKKKGRAALEAVAAVLIAVPRQFQVAGHTDDVPISTQRFRSNWELSTARAIEVVRVLVAQGVNATALSAAGYAEFDPVAPNQGEASRRHNRRIEITLQPNIDELISMPEVK